MSSRVEYPQELCLEKISTQAGRAFGIGVTINAFFDFTTKSYNSCTGLRERFIAGAQAVRMNTPRSASRFTAAYMLDYSIQHSARYVRQKEDPWNSIMGSLVGGGVLGMRFGPRGMAAAGIFSACLDGSWIMLERFVDHSREPN